MKKMLLLAAGLVASVALLAGCNGTAPAKPTPTASELLAQMHTAVTKACNVAQDTLPSAIAMQSQLPADQQDIVEKVNKGVGDFCAAHDTISVASVRDFVKTSIPGVIKIVNASTLDPTMKADVNVALVVFSAALSSAISNFGQATATSPASTPAAESTPLSAAPLQ